MKQGAADGRVELRFGRSMHLSQKLQKSRGSEAIAARCRGGRETGAEAAIVEMTDTAECARGSSGGTMAVAYTAACVQRSPRRDDAPRSWAAAEGRDAAPAY